MGMSPGITAGVVEPDDETRLWLRSRTEEVLIWIADTPDYLMQYAEPVSLGDRVCWQLRTIESGDEAAYQSHAMLLADALLAPTISILVGQVELTEQTDPTARDVGLLAGSIASIGVVYFVEIEGPDPNLHFVRLHDSTVYPEQLEDIEGHRCYARGLLVGLNLDRSSSSPEALALADRRLTGNEPEE